jgi:protease-3
VLAYRDNLKAKGRPELLVIGNLTAEQSTAMARQIQQQLGSDGNEWCRNKDVLINSQQLAIFEKAGNSTDSALAAVFARRTWMNSSSAASSLLGQIIQPWFYNQLRTEEQLGYAVFAFPMNVGRQWGWASCCKAAINSLLSSGSASRPSSRPRKLNCGR